MLAKCANPACNTPFRRLSEGKLFLLESESKRDPDEFDPRKNKPARRVEHFWLCNDCARLVTLTFDTKSGVVTVPLPAGSRLPLTPEVERRPVSPHGDTGMLARAASYRHD